MSGWEWIRSVMYLVGFPNLLVSLHPDYVMTHLMTPLAADRTHVECAWAFPKDPTAGWLVQAQPAGGRQSSIGPQSQSLNGIALPSRKTPHFGHLPG